MGGPNYNSLPCRTGPGGNSSGNITAGERLLSTMLTEMDGLELAMVLLSLLIVLNIMLLNVYMSIQENVILLDCRVLLYWLPQIA